jgi:hypothetical protein
LLAFAAGFIVRPFGALVFGRLGDMIGRKYTFLVTILLMGASTFIVGILPTYATIGVAAPIILIVLRMLQGLALGGEYGGAATYMAEHAPHGKRGAYTAWIQTTATLGLLLSLIVMLGISVYIRLQMNESPAFQKMKSEGKTSQAPLAESFGQWKNLKIVLLALAVVTYFPLFNALTKAANPDLAKAQQTARSRSRRPPVTAPSRATPWPARSTSPSLRHRQALPGPELGELRQRRRFGCRPRRHQDRRKAWWRSRPRAGRCGPRCACLGRQVISADCRGAVSFQREGAFALPAPLGACPSGRCGRHSAASSGLPRSREWPPAADHGSTDTRVRSSVAPPP